MKVLNKALVFIFILSFMFPVVAQEKQKVEIIRKAKTQPGAFSPNIQFVVDASSTIHWSDELMYKFALAWKWITNKVAGDEVYFSVCVFHDKDKFVISKWIDAGGPNGHKQFKKAWKWIKDNTGTRSYGLNAIKNSIKRINPLIHNRVERRRLTVVVISDGGLTEAAAYEPEKGESYFKLIDDAIVEAQVWRKTKGLFPATICTIGLENKELWSSGVKRSNNECQKWMQKIGKKYGGGAMLVREKKKK